jgi:hypothetical protein
MIEKEKHIYLEDEESCIIISPEGEYQLVVPDDEDAITAKVAYTFLKVMQHEELLEYVLKWQPDSEFNLGDAEEVWH